MPVIVIAPYDRVFEKTVSNMQEVAARGGKIILITDAEGRGARRRVESLATLMLPDMPATVTPMVYAHAGAADRLSYRRAHGHRRRPAAQSREIGDSRVIGRDCMHTSRRVLRVISRPAGI